MSSATWLKREHYKADQSESGQSLSHLALQLEDQRTPRSREDSSLEGEDGGDALLGLEPSSAGLSCRL